MGARDCTRASAAARRTVLAQPDELQWGRAIVRAQAYDLDGLSKEWEALQWGRAIVRAQAAHSAYVSATCGCASMGARDCTRASCAAVRWIRVRSACFNGGARLYARKPCSAASRSRSDPGFNGGA